MPLQNIVASKYKLFVIISISIMAILVIPVILPHITHTNMIYHIFLHIVSLIIAVFLSVVSYLAYKRNGGDRLLFMTLGFLSLVVVEILYLFYTIMEIEDTNAVIPIIDIEIPHIILLVMLTLFGIGVFKVNNKS
jgi:NO-binding membrane sensor protein with MHYT domain